METAYAFRLFSLLLLSLLLHLSLVPAARAADPPALPLTASEYSVVILVAKGAVIAALYANDTAALDYMDVAFDRQSDVLNEETKDMSYAEVSERVQGWVRETTGLSDKRVKQGLELGEVEEAVRVSFKYAAIRSVFGTPMFMINQIMVPGLDSESGLQDWKMYLEPLLARAERKD
ncbi:hypothetical protein VYU27_007992 [Nannochloropsis oceanica]